MHPRRMLQITMSLLASITLLGCDVYVHQVPVVAQQQQVRCLPNGRCFGAHVFAPPPVVYTTTTPPQPTVAYPPPPVQQVAAPPPPKPSLSALQYENAARSMFTRIQPGKTEQELVQDLKAILKAHGITTYEEREVFYRAYRQLAENTTRVPVGVHMWNTANPVEATRMREEPSHFTPTPAPQQKAPPAAPRPSSPRPRKDEPDEDVLDRIAKQYAMSIR